MKQIAFCLALLISFLIAAACINEESITIEGRPVIINFQEIPRGIYHEEYMPLYVQELKVKDSLWKAGNRIEDFSDYGVLLIYHGRLEEAKKVFIEIEARQPGRYSTAANLGTTYELLGKNDSALYWIKRSVAIDPQSHHGSEWLHVKILEAKIQKSNFNTSFLIGTDFGNDTLPKSNMSSHELDKLSKALHYQLNERVSFVKPKDEMVGLLLFELGNIKAIQSDLVTAMKIYDMAIQYGYQGKVLETRYNEFRKRLINANVDNEYVKKLKDTPAYMAPDPAVKVEAATEVPAKGSSTMLYYILALFAIIAATFFIIKRRKVTE